MKFIIIKKKAIMILLILSILVTVFSATFFSVKPTSSPKFVHSIVIDAGHGGIDGGCTGISTGVKESDLNLKYSKKLEEICKSFGFKVVMTRTSEEGLYSPFAANKKRSEMEKREKIIKSSNADLFVSVHMNSFSNSNLSGAQVFYKEGSGEGKEFADEISSGLKDGNVRLRGGSKSGDYYVLNCHDKPGVLIECGFLSNAEEEKLLMRDDYVEMFCKSAFQGILRFLKM